MAVGDSRASLIDLETGKIERDLFTEDDRKKFTQKLQLNHCVADPFDQRVIFTHKFFSTVWHQGKI